MDLGPTILALWSQTSTLRTVRTSCLLFLGCLVSGILFWWLEWTKTGNQWLQWWRWKGMWTKAFRTQNLEPLVQFLAFQICDEPVSSSCKKDNNPSVSTSCVCCEGTSWQDYSIRIKPICLSKPTALAKMLLKASFMKMGNSQSILAMSKLQSQDDAGLCCFSHTFTLADSNIQKRRNLFTLGYSELPLETLSSELASFPLPWNNVGLCWMFGGWHFDKWGY